jgi:hypothetical protein
VTSDPTGVVSDHSDPGLRQHGRAGDHLPSAWVVTRESIGDAPAAVVQSTAAVTQEGPLTVGRTGRLQLGVDVPDPGISRIALTITAEPDGWTIVNSARNGVVIHPWGLAPQRAAGRTRIRWPLVAIRVLGHEPTAHHWVLLECDAYLGEEGGPGGRRGTTLQATPPKPLTPAEAQAIAVVFGSALAWPPPAVPADPLQLKQAARILGISSSAVKLRLEGARAKAEALGLTRQVRVTDPDYVHVLTAAGYVTTPTERCAG